METRSQSRSKLLSSTSDDGEKATDPTIVPKSSLAARLKKREAMKRSSMETNDGDQESDSSDGAEEEEEDDDFEISDEEAAALDAPNGAVADDLTAVMEDLTIGEDDEEKADMVNPEEKVCLVEAIEQFDPAGYDESADPDYDPLSAPVDNGDGNEAGEMDSASNDEEEGMEQ